ncbi:hypothetical protein AB0N17_44040 [Streptomyces sp. NPDC051133]|uniref:hypothetical protein n=1 Tax=Streptomyces sp. NPDC051133 TaxID=3155521 RepID=UPI00342F3E0A
MSLSVVTADNDDVRTVLADDVDRLASDYLQDGLRSDMNLVLVSPKHDGTRIVRRDGPNRISHAPRPFSQARSVSGATPVSRSLQRNS